MTAFPTGRHRRNLARPATIGLRMAALPTNSSRRNYAGPTSLRAATTASPTASSRPSSRKEGAAADEAGESIDFEGPGAIWLGQARCGSVTAYLDLLPNWQ